MGLALSPMYEPDIGYCGRAMIYYEIHFRVLQSYNMFHNITIPKTVNNFHTKINTSPSYSFITLNHESQVLFSIDSAVLVSGSLNDPCSGSPDRGPTGN